MVGINKENKNFNELTDIITITKAFNDFNKIEIFTIEDKDYKLKYFGEKDEYLILYPIENNPILVNYNDTLASINNFSIQRPDLNFNNTKTCFSNYQQADGEKFLVVCSLIYLLEVMVADQDPPSTKLDMFGLRRYDKVRYFVQRFPNPKHALESIIFYKNNGENFDKLTTCLKYHIDENLEYNYFSCKDSFIKIERNQLRIDLSYLEARLINIQEKFNQYTLYFSNQDKLSITSFNRDNSTKLSNLNLKDYYSDLRLNSVFEEKTVESKVRSLSYPLKMDPTIDYKLMLSLSLFGKLSQEEIDLNYKRFFKDFKEINSICEEYYIPRFEIAYELVSENANPKYLSEKYKDEFLRKCFDRNEGSGYSLAYRLCSCNDKQLWHFMDQYILESYPNPAKAYKKALIFIGDQFKYKDRLLIKCLRYFKDFDNVELFDVCGRYIEGVTGKLFLDLILKEDTLKDTKYLLEDNRFTCWTSLLSEDVIDCKFNYYYLLGIKEARFSPNSRYIEKFFYNITKLTQENIDNAYSEKMNFALSIKNEIARSIIIKKLEHIYKTIGSEDSRDEYNLFLFRHESIQNELLSDPNLILEEYEDKFFNNYFKLTSGGFECFANDSKNILTKLRMYRLLNHGPITCSRGVSNFDIPGYMRVDCEIDYYQIFNLKKNLVTNQDVEESYQSVMNRVIKFENNERNKNPVNIKAINIAAAKLDIVYEMLKTEESRKIYDDFISQKSNCKENRYQDKLLREYYINKNNGIIGFVNEVTNVPSTKWNDQKLLRIDPIRYVLKNHPDPSEALAKMPEFFRDYVDFTPVMKCLQDYELLNVKALDVCGKYSMYPEGQEVMDLLGEI
ncbi:MAG: hypothetical protein AABY27_06205 [Pseudomonadota bacterium]